MSKLSRRRVLLAKVESTYGVDAVPTGADNAILIEDLNWSMDRLRLVERPAIRSSIGTLQQLYGGSLQAASFTVEVKGSGTAGTAPEIGVLLRGCAMAENIVASTSVTYLPASASQASLTLYIYEDGTLTKLLGARGTVDFTGATGGRLMANFSFTGHFTGPADTALATPTYDSAVPAVLIGGSFSIGSFAAVIESMNFSLGNELGVPPDINAADGYAEVHVIGRDVNGSINPEQPLVATAAFLADLKSGTTRAFDSGTFGAVGNQFRVQMPSVYYRDISPGEREGVLFYELPFGAVESTTDDEISLAFT